MGAFRKLSVTVAVGIVVAAAAGNACSVTSTTTSNDDGGGASSSGASSGTKSDGGSSSGASSSGASSSGASSSGASSSGSGCTLVQNAQTGDQKCDTCSQASCCDVLNACWGDPNCVALEKCAFDCQSDGGPPDAGGCIQDCANKAGQALVQKHNAWVQCIEANCKTECAGP